MHAFDNAIGLKHEKLAAIRRFHDSAVVSRTCGDCSCKGKIEPKLIEQPVFAQVAKFHCERISGNARMVRVSELNSECMVIVTRMEPLHS